MRFLSMHVTLIHYNVTLNFVVGITRAQRMLSMKKTTFLLFCYWSALLVETKPYGELIPDDASMSYGGPMQPSMPSAPAIDSSPWM